MYIVLCNDPLKQNALYYENCMDAQHIEIFDLQGKKIPIYYAIEYDTIKISFQKKSIRGTKLIVNVIDSNELDSYQLKLMIP